MPDWKVGQTIQSNVKPGVYWERWIDPIWVYLGPPEQPQEQLRDLLEKASSEERKKYPVKTGFIDYFRDAIFRQARVSYEGNQKHNPGQPTHWARGKSMDHGDCCARHMLCDDDEEHLANKAWRANADLQMFLEKKYNIKPPPGCK